ncbi:kinase-like protein [Lentinus tigrinus ALCF2SS1-7]|nr:kinase-like protein [Lentinus tigrinus ALCF2SS1-7]
MSRRPSFRDPFTRAPLCGTKDRAGGTAVSSSVDSGPSRAPIKPPSPSLDALIRQPRSGFKLHNEPGEALPRPRNGSITLLKDVGNGLLKLMKRWTEKRTHRSADVRETATPKGPPPLRPPRCETVDSEVLDFIDQHVASGLGVPTAPSEIAVVPVGRVRRNGIALPPDVSSALLAAKHLQKPQLVDPRPCPSVPPLQKDGDASSSQIGDSLGSSASPPPSSSYWTVVQRNRIRLPHGSVRRWVTGGVLGAGGFGRVYLVYDTVARRQCAIKVVNIGKRMSESCCRGLINELRVLSLLGSEPQTSPFLLRPYSSDSNWAWRSSKLYLHILTEAYTGRDLFAYKQKLNFESLRLVCAELVLGLNHLHRHGIVHHDIKPLNILVTAKGHCVIADFGGARFMDATGKLTRDSDTMPIMTTAYAAPELTVLLQSDEVLEYDERADYWSLAATVVSLIMDDKYLPGAAADLHFMAYRLEKIRTEMIKMQAPVELLCFVTQILKIDPLLRPSYAELMTHSLFEHINWDDVLAQKDPAIPFVQEVVVEAHGWKFKTPKVHSSEGATADFLEELRKENFPLVEDDSYDVNADIAATS